MVAQPWDDSMFLEATPVEEEDLWHVAVEPDEVKVLTLEQLDDLFRLDIIDGSTKVWQPGMDEWLPLSIVAGFEDNTGEIAAAAPQPRGLTALPPVGFSPVAPAPLPSVAPPAAAFAQSPFAHNSFAPAPASLRPVVSSPIYQTETASSRAARWVLGLAMVVGLGLILYRNDVVRDAATSSGQQSMFANLESALGGPSFGTLRSVEELSASLGLDDVQIPNALRVEEPKKKDAETAASQTPAETSQPQNKADADEVKQKADSKAESESDSDAPTLSLDALPKEGMGNAFKAQMDPSSKKPSTKPRAVPRRTDKSKAKTGYSKDLGFKGSSNKYDPLNPTL